jgi:hypothetical protein
VDAFRLCPSGNPTNVDDVSRFVVAGGGDDDETHATFLSFSAVDAFFLAPRGLRAVTRAHPLIDFCALILFWEKLASKVTFLEIRWSERQIDSLFWTSSEPFFRVDVLY